MAHFALIEDATVRQVIAVSNDAIDGGTFPESETIGQAFLLESGIAGEWLQCSYSGAFRGAYPGQGWEWKANKKRKDGGEFLPPVDSPIIVATT